MAEYIEREVAYSLAKKVCKAIDSNPRVLLPKLILDLIDDIPAADVRPVVRGKWIRMDMHKGMEQYKCAVCRFECYVPECMGEPMYAFCPNCGCAMEETE